MSDVPEGWVTYPAEELVAALRRLGFTIYPPGSAVPALVEAAKRYAAAPSLRAKRLMAHQLHVAASKVAGEGER